MPQINQATEDKIQAIHRLFRFRQEDEVSHFLREYPELLDFLPEAYAQMGSSALLVILRGIHSLPKRRITKSAEDPVPDWSLQGPTRTSPAMSQRSRFSPLTGIVLFWGWNCECLVW